MPKVKAILMDIDGTLLKVGTVHIRPEIVERTERMRKNGTIVVVATGRSAYIVNPDLMGEFRADYYICSNGAEILDAEGNRIFEDRLNVGEIEMLAELADRTGFVLGYAFEDGTAIYSNYALYRSLYPKPGPGRSDPVGEGPYDGWMKDCPAQDRHKTGLPFCAVLHGVPADIVFPPELDTLNFVRFRPGSYDVFHRTVNKATAAEWLMRRLGLTMADCAAAGDGNNDIPMLKAAGVSFAMGNARPACREAADYVIGDVAENGLLDAFDMLEL